MKKYRVLFLLLFATLVFGGQSMATPEITSITGTPEHDETFTVNGTGFGTKDPAGPLLWDNGEGKTDGTLITTGHPANAASRVNYSEIKPNATLSAPYRMTYRATPYAPQGSSGSLSEVLAPHGHSSRIMSFGHEDNIGPQFNDGANGWLVVPNTLGAGHYASNWTILYYYRYNSEWPVCGTSSNDKFLVLNDTLATWGYQNHYHYWDFNKKLPCALEPYARITPMTATGVINAQDPDLMPDTVAPWGQNQSHSSAVSDAPYDPQLGWQKFEVRITSSSMRFLVDNKNGWWGQNNPNWMAGTAIGQNGAGSVSIGGYYRETMTPVNTENNNAHRMIDDLYVDDTLARVVGGNASTYSACTVVEPQIPSAWSDTGITVLGNQGNLGNDAWLYVFDAAGTYNENGYSISFSPPDTTAPTVTITTSDPQNITSDSLQIAWTSSDDVGVTACRWRIGAQPDDTHGQLDTSPATVSGFQSGENTLCVACRDIAGNWGYNSLTVNYRPPQSFFINCNAGSNGDGSAASPFNSWASVRSNALAGDSVYFRGDCDVDLAGMADTGQIYLIPYTREKFTLTGFVSNGADTKIITYGRPKGDYFNKK